MNSFFKVGDIGVLLDTSGDRFWRTYLEHQLNTQLDGFQCNRNVAISSNYQLRIRDYSLLPVGDNISLIVPRYCMFFDNIYVDLQMGVALREMKNRVDYWCSPTTFFSAPFLLQFLLLQQGKTFTHSAAISVDGIGILLPAYGGIGKTAFISQAANNKRVKVIGDDLAILTKDGMLEPYLRPFCLYKYHKALFPDFFSNHHIYHNKYIAWGWRACRSAANMIFSRFEMSSCRIPKNVATTGYVSVSPTRLFHDSSLEKSSVQIGKIYLLQRSKGLTDLKMEPIDKNYLTSFLLNGFYHEFHKYSRFLCSWLSNVGVSLSEYFCSVEKPIKSVIEKSTEVKKITIPEKMPIAETGERLLDFILKA